MQQLLLGNAAIDILDCSDRYFGMQQLLIENAALKIGNTAIRIGNAAKKYRDCRNS